MKKGVQSASGGCRGHWGCPPNLKIPQEWVIQGVDEGHSSNLNLNIEINMENVHIEYLAPADTEEAVNVLVRAFSIYFEAEKELIKPIDNERRSRLVFGLMLKHLHGTVFVAKKGDRIVGVMRIVEWPLCQMSSLERVRYVLTFLLNMRASAFKYLVRRIKWYRLDPKEPHWHLAPIGVIPEFQGHGIGSQLLNGFCEYIDAEGKAAYLETDREENVRLYERFGFAVREEVVIEREHNWFMWRPPRHNLPPASS